MFSVLELFPTLAIKTSIYFQKKHLHDEKLKKTEVKLMNC